MKATNPPMKIKIASVNLIEVKLEAPSDQTEAFVQPIKALKATEKLNKALKATEKAPQGH